MDPFPDHVIRDSKKAPMCVDYGLLRTNDEGLYSTVLPAYTEHVVGVILKHFPGVALRESSILDSTANIGGDTVNFIHNLPRTRVTAVEFNRENMPLLEYNIKALGFGDRAEAVEANCLTYVSERSPEAPPFDFVYCDPPRGGPHEWKAKRFMMLKLAAPNWSTRVQDTVPVYTFVAQVFGLGVSRAVVLKAPQNFDARVFRQELVRAGHRCSVTCEIVRKKARGRGRPPVAYHLYVVKLLEGVDRKGKAPAEEDPGEPAVESKGGEGPPPAPLETFAQIGAWLGSHTSRDSASAGWLLNRIGTFLDKRLHRAPRRLVADVKAYVREQALRGTPDGEVLAGLSAMCARYRVPARQQGQQLKGRASTRIQDILPTLRDVLTHETAPKVEQYLDVGCAEGGLTMAFGDALDLAPENIHGCDILAAAPSEGFTFASARAERLPYRDGQFQVVSFIMSLHHLKDLQGALVEAQRVLAPGGILVLREHDCRHKYFGAFLDIVHFLYATVVNDEVVLRPGHEAEDFEGHREMLTSTFRTKEAWSEALDRAGFTFVCKREPMVVDARGRRTHRPDLYNSYYAFYRK
jgi:ubiquinone/menaquinone biosynthesis C-methylase UbiE